MFFPIIEKIARALEKARRIYWPVSNESKGSRVIILINVYLLMIACAFMVAGSLIFLAGEIEWKKSLIFIFGVLCMIYSCLLFKDIDAEGKTVKELTQWLRGEGHWYSILGMIF